MARLDPDRRSAERRSGALAGARGRSSNAAHTVPPPIRGPRAASGSGGGASGAHPQ